MSSPLPPWHNRLPHSRIAPDVRTVSWTESGSVAIGYHNCDWCKVETPDPTDDVVIAFVREYPGASTMWPSRPHGEGWQPPGWTWSDHMELCPDCSQARDHALREAKQKRVTP